MSELPSPSEIESELIFHKIFLTYGFILILTKVRLKGSMHIPPSIHTKEILKTIPFGLLNSRDKIPSINGETLKDTRQTTKVFPFGMTT